MLTSNGHLGREHTCLLSPRHVLCLGDMRHPWRNIQRETNDVSPRCYISVGDKDVAQHLSVYCSQWYSAGSPTMNDLTEEEVNHLLLVMIIRRRRRRRKNRNIWVKPFHLERLTFGQYYVNMPKLRSDDRVFFIFSNVTE